MSESWGQPPQPGPYRGRPGHAGQPGPYPGVAGQFPGQRPPGWSGPVPYPSPQGYEPPSTPPRRKRRGLWIALTAAGVVAVLAAGVLVFVVMKKPKNTASGDGLPAVTGPHRVAESGASGPAPTGHWVGLGKKWLVPTDPQTQIGITDATGTDGTRVFVAEGKIVEPSDSPPSPGTVTAYDAASGKQLWQTQFQWAQSTLPIGAGNVVILAAADHDIRSAEGIDIVGLDATTGKELWRRGAGASHSDPFGRPTLTTIDNRISTPGTMLNGLFYYADGSTIFAVDPATGKDKYKHTTQGFDVTNGPVVSGDQLVFMVAVNDENSSPSVTLHDVHLVVSRPDLSGGTDYPMPRATKDEPSCGDFVGSKVLADGDTVLVGTDEVLCGFQRTPDNHVKQLWTTRLSEQNFYAPVSGIVPLLDFSGEANRNVVIGLDATTGKEVWKNDPWDDKTASSDDPTAVLARSDIAVVDGTLFSLGHHVQIIDPRTGKLSFDSVPRTAEFGNVGGGDVPTAVGGTVVMKRADGLWAFN